MQVLGISYNTNTNGDTISTLYVSSEFESYYQNPEAGRNCQGVRTESIYNGLILSVKVYRRDVSENRQWLCHCGSPIKRSVSITTSLL